VVSLGLSSLFRGAAYNGRLVAQQVLGDFPVPSLALSWRMFPDQALSRIRWGTFHVLLSLLGTLCPWQLGKVVRRTSLLLLLLLLLLFFFLAPLISFLFLIHPMSSELWLWWWRRLGQVGRKGVITVVSKQVSYCGPSLPCLSSPKPSSILMIPTIFPFALPTSTRVALGYYFYFILILFFYTKEEKKDEPELWRMLLAIPPSNQGVLPEYSSLWTPKRQKRQNKKKKGEKKRQGKKKKK